MSVPRLTYFDGRGLGEGIRLLLATCGVEFTELNLNEREEYLKLLEDGKLPFKQIPLLEIDGLEIVQFRAIVRYIAAREGMMGKTLAETAQIDMLFEGARDFQAYFFKIGFNDPKEVLETAKSQALPRYLPAFEQALKKSGTGYLVGENMSLADIGLLEVLLTITEYFGEEALKNYPQIKTFYAKMTSQERISAFLKGPQRKRGNDDVLIATCRRVLLLPF